MSEKIIGIGRGRKPLHPQRCETCRHFDPPEGAIETGCCVAQFPNVIMALGVGPGGAAALTYFPQMKPEQRCGKWESSHPDAPTVGNEIPY